MTINREEALFNMQSTILNGGSITTMERVFGCKKWYRHNLIDVLADSLGGDMANELGSSMIFVYQNDDAGNLPSLLEKAVESYCSDDDRITEYIAALEDERLDNIAREQFEDGL